MNRNPIKTGKKIFLVACFLLLDLNSFAADVNSAPNEVLVTTADGKIVDKGLALAMKTDRLDSGYEDIVVTGEIVNRAPTGEENHRKFKMITVEMTDDGDRRFIKVTDPAALRDTMFLSHAHALKSDDVWLMLPSSARIRRVAAQDKTGHFLSSELTLEDISPWEIQKYTYRYLGESDCGKDHQHHCFLIENTPNYKYSGYMKQVEFLDSEIYQPRKIEYYAFNNQLIKVLKFNGYQQFNNRYWRPKHMKMTNKQTGEESEIFWSEYHFNAGYTASQLSPTNIFKLRR